MKNNKSRQNQKKAIVVVFLAILVVLAIMITAIWILFKKYMNMIDFDYKVDPVVGTEDVLTDDEIMEEIMEEILAEEENMDVEDSPQEEIEKLESQMKEQVEEVVDTMPLLSSDDVYNVLLVGCDSRKKGGSGRSDAMILVSVNKSTKEIYLTSIMRDTYVTIPNKENNRINAAYAFGGGSLLLDTIETNFSIDVDRYVAFDFYSFVDVVDSIGGIDIDVSEAEMEVLNGYLVDLNYLNGRELDEYWLEKAGYQHLNGNQALCYSRIRHAGNGDFERTERQHEVIDAVIEKVKSLTPAKMNALLSSLLPGIKTNYTEKEILALLVDAIEWISYDIKDLRLPVDGSYESVRINKMAVLGIDLQKNYDVLAKEIYGIE